MNTLFYLVCYKPLQQIRRLCATDTPQHDMQNLSDGIAWHNETCNPPCLHGYLVLLVLLQSEVPIPAADAADLLQLAVNSLNERTARAVLGRLPSQLEPTAARRLLVTAAVRQRGDLARRVAAIRIVKQHLDAPTLTAVLRALLLAAESRAYPTSSQLLDSVSGLLFDQQAVAQQLEGAALVGMLHAAVKSRAPDFALPLFQSLNAQQLGAAAVLEVLTAAVDALDSYSVRHLCSLPAAQQLACEDVVRLLQAASGKRSVDVMQRLSRLSAAEQLSSEVMVQLLQAAAGAGDAPMVCTLCDFASAQRLTKDQVMCVLRAAEESGNDIVVRMCSRLRRN
jgi:hypothetical protein